MTLDTDQEPLPCRRPTHSRLKIRALRLAMLEPNINHPLRCAVECVDTDNWRIVIVVWHERLGRRY